MDNNDLGIKATNNNVAQPDPIKANIDEEAKAEEAFVNDEEDAVFNPFVENGDVAEEEEILTDADMEIPGAVGSGNLETVMPNDPINNEETFSDDVKMQDLQSDIDTKPAIDDEALPSAEETVKVNIGESMQPEEKPGAENTELASQMDNLLNDADTVENTTADAEATPSVAETSAPATEVSAGETTSNSPVAEAVAANPVVETAPVTTESQAEATTQAAEPAKKKGGAGKIIAIIVILLLLIGCGIGVVLFMNWHESKDKVASDAMSKLFNVKLVDDKITSAGNGIGVTKVSGKVTATNKEAEDYKEGDRYVDTKSVVGDFDIEIEDVNTKFKGSITLNYANGKSNSAGIEAAYLAGGKAYVKLGKMDDYASLFNSAINNIVDEDDDNIKEEKSKAVKEFEEKEQEILSSRIEDKWIGISNDTFKYLIGEDNYNDEYSCIVSSLEKVSKDSKSKLLEAYEKNSFFEFGDTVENVSGAKDGLTYYEIKINDEKLKKFGDDVEKIDSSVEISQCFESMAEEYTKDSSGKVSKTATKTDKNEITTKIYFGVKSWSHEVLNIIVEDEDKYEKFVGSFDLSYDAVKVAEPGDAKQLEKVAEEAYDAYVKLVGENWDAYIESECGEDDGDYYFTYCEEYAKESYDEMKDLSFAEYLKTTAQSAFSSYDDDFDCDEGLDCLDDDDWDY